MNELVTPMAEFNSYNDYPLFAWYVMRKTRYVREARTKNFLEAVLETCGERTTVLAEKTVLWRAQLGHGDGFKVITEDVKFPVEAPHKPERMKPLLDRAYEGRVNPRGIPCLYLSTDMNTAMSETRPWIGSFVSVAQFVVLRDLRLVDCSSETESPVDDDFQKWAWWYINRAFSEPVTRSDEVDEYAPTQVLAETFRSDRYDGIMYGSKLGDGTTIAVFDVTAATISACRLFKVDGVHLTFSEAANPYFIDVSPDPEVPKID
jgi:RES domain-containing protein